MTPVFCFPVPVRDIPMAGRTYNVTADSDARGRLAKLLGLPEIAQLSADMHLRPGAGGIVHLSGSLQALVTQIDVVTLEPVRQEVAEGIDLDLVPAARPNAKRKHADDVDETSDDEVEAYDGGTIDLGRILCEHLALGLDPYPRAPGVVFAGHVEDDPDADPSPFAALAALKDQGR